MISADENFITGEQWTAADINRIRSLRMSPPRRPKCEKPATTIRYLHRQIRQMADTMASLRARIADQDKVITGYDAQLQEANDIAERQSRRVADMNVMLSEANHKNRQQSERRQFLEGYYAARQEALSGRPHSGAGAGNPRTLQDGRQNAEGARPDVGATGDGRSTGG
jgi:hypothetical protein